MASGDPSAEGVVLWTRVSVAASESVPVRWALAAEPGPEASVRKALADRHGQRLFDLAVDLCGADGTLARENPPQLPGLFPWVAGFLFSPALTVGGGTAEVQRNIIAERVLGLPRDPAA